MSLEIRDLRASYERAQILHGICLSVEPGTIHVLLGRNGAGKTTTLRTIYGLMRSWSGTVELDGRAIGGLKPHLVTRAGLAFVPEYRGVFGNLTVAENLAIGERRGSDWPVARVLDLFPPLGSLMARAGRQLSGGEQQMLAIGRALMSGPRYLLLDEPSQGLAPVIVDTVVETLLRLKTEGLGILLVEQNAELALEIGDQASLLEHGEIAFRDTAADIRATPEVVHGLLAVG